MPDAARITVSVIYAEPDHAFDAIVSLPDGATVSDAIARSGFRKAWPDVVVDDARLGVFARNVTLTTRLRDGDRVEIYRSLKVDPKEARRRRARHPA